MITTPNEHFRLQQETTIEMLHKLNIGIHRLGYRHLTVAVPCFALDDNQSLTKELYPSVADSCGCADWHSVERSIRTAIRAAWNHRDPAVWEQFFPNQAKAPSNKQFIATLAERLKQNIPLPKWGGANCQEDAVGITEQLCRFKKNQSM